MLVLLGCSESFSPKGPYQEQLVVYSVLTNVRSAQFVRVYSTYNPSGVDPYDNTSDSEITGAQVFLMAGGTTYAFRDTIVARDQTSRYTGGIHAYVADPMPVIRGDSYLLTVATPSMGTATGTSLVPTAGIASLANRYALESPGEYSEDILVTVYLSPQAFGYAVRLSLEFDVFIGGQWEPHRAEIPQSLKIGTGQGSALFNYPSLTRRQSQAQTTESVSFSHEAYVSLLGELDKQYPGLPIRFKDAVIVLTQADQPFYTYYSVANGFRDEFSIRTDEPDYSNISGGLGVFGSFANDTLVVPVAESIGYNRDSRVPAAR